MATLIFSDTTTDPASLCRSLDIPEDLWSGGGMGRQDMVLSHKPYLLGSDRSAQDRNILDQLSPYSVAEPLSAMCQAFGGATTLALAELVDELRALDDHGLAAAGSALSAGSARMQRFHAAVAEYQTSMQEFSKAARWSVRDGPQRAEAARLRMQRAGAVLTEGFRDELAAASHNLSHRQRDLLRQDGRVALRVSQARGVARLDIRSPLEASLLARLGRVAKVVGRGLVVFDFVRRGAGVWDEARKGGDWEKAAAVESAGFTASVVASPIATSIGVRALGMLVIALPTGWALVFGGLAVVAAATASGMVADYLLSRLAQEQFDVQVRFPGNQP